MNGRRYVAKTERDLWDVMAKAPKGGFKITTKVPSLKEQNKPKVWVKFSKEGVYCQHKPTCIDGEDCLVKAGWDDCIENR